MENYCLKIVDIDGWANTLSRMASPATLLENERILPCYSYDMYLSSRVISFIVAVMTFIIYWAS